MSEIKDMPLTQTYVSQLANQHRWAATGVSSYPPRDPLVGQTTFFRRYRNFIKTVDQDHDEFTHVFAVEAEWGKGKSRIGHELVAQINDCSQGWFVREGNGELINAQLFDDEVRRDEYLGLYLRYSQIADKHQNADNWFAYGLYKALTPLATKAFDGSIQSEIAKQALRRLEPLGFEASQLKDLLQLDREYTALQLYYDKAKDADGNVVTVTELVDRAYGYLQQFGVKYLLVVLDELETVAEAADTGMDRDEAVQLDGQAIQMIGRAIKEEDPRRKLPWLRYVALCSPLLGQTLREIKSTARRFELVELESNAFADVSDYVAQLQQDNRLQHDYPKGLVQAAYAMSGANFGWFNVIMANIDVVLDNLTKKGKPIPEISELFDEVLHNSGRVEQWVLDKHAIDGLKTKDHHLREQAKSLLFNQLPQPLSTISGTCSPLLVLQNEYDEPVVSLYRKVNWDRLDCRQALEQAKFKRDGNLWIYQGDDQQGLDLNGMLRNLRAFAINELGGEDTLLVPLSQGEFHQLVELLYDHPAAGFAADALWTKFIGHEKQLDEELGSHIGPSVAMLLRLDKRYRSQQKNSMIFRKPEQATAHAEAMQHAEKEWQLQPTMRERCRLLGLFRLLDKNWDYNEPAYTDNIYIRKGYDFVLQFTSGGKGIGQTVGLRACEGLKLHPKGRAGFAWVNNEEQLNQLNEYVRGMHADVGRFPVVAFTSSVGVYDNYHIGSVTEELKDNILLYQLDISEIDAIERIGLDVSACVDFELKDQLFSTKFHERLRKFRTAAYEHIHQWRARLNQRGLIAWPLRPSGKLGKEDKELLFKAWKQLVVDAPLLGGLNDIGAEYKPEKVSQVLSRLSVTDKVLMLGYDKEEHAGLFSNVEQPALAQAKIPTFLAAIARPNKSKEQLTWTQRRAEQDWYWGYLWQPASSGLSVKAVFDDWMWWCSQLHLLVPEDPTAAKTTWQPKTRADLRLGALEHAQAWFEGAGSNDYRATVSALTSVYGHDKVPGLFAWKDAAKVGTQTTIAAENLDEAHAAMASLDSMEVSLSNDLSEVVLAFPKILKARSDVLMWVDKVKNHRQQKVTLGNERVVKLEDVDKSLFERVEKARLFADQVKKACDNIKNAASATMDEIVADPRAQMPFPRRLFTMSLDTIKNILEGAVDQGTATDTQKGEVKGGSDTLNFYLRTLQLDKASDRLQALANEAGADLYHDAYLPLSANRGHIVRAYYDLVERFDKTQDGLAQLESQIDRMKCLLGSSVPDDYPYPEHLKDILKYEMQRGDIVESLQDDIDDKVDAFKAKYAEAMRRGDFSAIVTMPVRLLKAAQERVAVMSGHVRKIDNAIRKYQQEAIAHINDGFRMRLRPLFLSVGKEGIPAIELRDIENEPLLDLHTFLDMRQMVWHKEAAAILNDMGISVERWEDIAAALLNRKQPQLTTQEQQALEDKGILKVQITFGCDL